MRESVLRVGVVKSVRGRTIEVAVDKMKNVPHLLFDGTLIRNVSVGSYIKINKGFERIIGVIESEEITEDKIEVFKDYKQNENKIVRILKIKIVGYLEEDKFNQGVKELPLIDNVCYILTEEEYNRVHDFIDDEKDIPIKIGHLASEMTKEIKVGVNNLFASHIGIFGNTGSGKSYTLASMYHSLFEEFGCKYGFKENSKFLLIDFNGEYIENEKGKDVIFSEEFKEVFDIPHRKLEIEKNSFQDIEILSIILDATEKTQKPFIKSVLNYSKFKAQSFNKIKFLKIDVLTNLLLKKNRELGVKALLNIFFDISDCVENKEVIWNIITFIQDKIGFNSSSEGYYFRLDNGSEIYDKRAFFEKIDPLFNLIQKIRFIEDNLLIGFLLKLILRFHYDIINGHANVEHISPLIRRAKSMLLKLNGLIELKKQVIFEKNIKIVSLKNIDDNALKKVLALVVCKEAYGKQKANGNSRDHLNIIIDEAHNILSYSSTRESETWKDYRLETFEEIIKEGRKFGTFLTIASQRPNDISQTILSQLHNYFLHRLINNKDIEAVERTVSYLDKVSFEALSILPTGTCVLAGLATKLPVMVKINKLGKKYQPHSQTIKLTKIWNANEQNSGLIENQEKESMPEASTDTDSFYDDLPF